MKYKLLHRMSSCRIILLLLGIIAGIECYGQISITSLPYTPAVTTFDTYNPSSAANLSATIPSGWTAASTITPTYRGQGNGTSNAGGYWSYGASGEFSLGALRSGTPGDITYTLSFVNNSGMTISSITLSWDYEQWRYANTSGWDCTGTGALASNAILNGKDFVGSATGTSGTVTVTPVPSFTLSGLSILNGTSFGISWKTTDLASADNGVAVDNFNISVCCGGLPVTWISFDVTQDDEQTSQIEWKTTEEINNAYFEIQRSIDGGRNFITIGKVNATADQQPINAYQFRDQNTASGKNFYRIKQVDLDGNFDFSPVRRVEFKSTDFTLEAWPNPSSSNVYLRVSHADEKGKIIMVNLIGQKVFEENFGNESSEHEVEVENLQPGIYTLIVLSGVTQQEEKIIITDK
jgi:Secretion system C-terminal sorting domain